MLLWDASFFTSKRIGRVGWLHYLRGLPLALILTLGSKQHQLYRDHPIEASRESVASYRKVTNPRNANINKEIISAGFIMFTEGYDPAMHRFHDAAGLKALMRDADRLNRHLFVNVGHIEFAREPYAYPEVCKILEDPAAFKHCSVLHGLLPSTTRHVFEYLGDRGVQR